MTAEEYLLSTVEYYSADPNRRCVSDTQGCVYSPITAKKVGISDGCAIGRFIPAERGAEIDKKFEELVKGEVAGSGYRELLEYFPEDVPQWMKDLPLEFVYRVQNFHDQGTNFIGPSGLSPYGRIQLSRIITDCNLNSEPFKKYIDENI